eukprot:360622-Chlamydomonas_euryale.AAC.9
MTTCRCRKVGSGQAPHVSRCGGGKVCMGSGGGRIARKALVPCPDAHDMPANAATIQKLVKEYVPGDVRVAGEAFDVLVNCCTGGPGKAHGRPACAAWLAPVSTSSHSSKLNSRGRPHPYPRWLCVCRICAAAVI